MGNTVIVLAGATGNLGGRIAGAILKRGASVKAIVRHDSDAGKVGVLQKLGATIARVDFNNPSELKRACSGASCVVSALSGLRNVIVGAQTLLLDAAVEAKVPRFIPSDYSIDFTRLPAGTNRNLDLRREFGEYLGRAQIAATSVLNGMFMDLLAGQAPYILFKLRQVNFWGNADQLLDFTTMDDSAEFIASAALDPSTPRFLRIAGDQISARGLAQAVSEVTGKKFRLFQAGSFSSLGMMIKILRAVAPQNKALYPPWQGMQYTLNMFSGVAKLEPLDNARYPGMHWTAVKEFLKEILSSRH